MPTAAAIIGAGLLGAGATIYASEQQRKAQEKALSEAKKGRKWQERMYYEELERRKPFYELGVGALPTLRAMIGGEYDVTKSPIYASLSESLSRAISRHLSARGLQHSGAGLRHASDLYTNLLTTLYGAEFDKLVTLANLGLSGFAPAPDLSRYTLGVADLLAQGGQQSAMTGVALGTIGSETAKSLAMWKMQQETLKALQGT